MDINTTMVELIHNWEEKLSNLEVLIDLKVGENIKNYDVLSQLPSIAESAAKVQLKVMLAYTLSCPQLSSIPDSMLNFNTIYDIIEYNMVEALTNHGEQYYRNNYGKDQI